MVSILIPAYNAEKTIQRCLDSVCMQTYKNIEVIVVNDGSADGTADIAERYSAKCDYIRVISQDNAGVATARNVCLKEANGDFILFVDADDWIEPDMIERMLALCGDADIVFCGSDHAENSAEIKRSKPGEPEVWDQQRQQLEFMKHQRMTGMLWNKMIRRSVTEGCCFNPETGYGEDAEFLWQVLKKSKKMLVTDEILYHHVLEASSISHLPFSEKKYSAIPMWERINREVEQKYPELLLFARERLTCAAGFSLYECKMSNYKNDRQISQMRTIVRKNMSIILYSDSISLKFKIFILVAAIGV